MWRCSSADLALQHRCRGMACTGSAPAADTGCPARSATLCSTYHPTLWGPSVRPTMPCCQLCIAHDALPVLSLYGRRTPTTFHPFASDTDILRRALPPAQVTSHDSPLLTPSQARTLTAASPAPARTWPPCPSWRLAPRAIHTPTPPAPFFPEFREEAQSWPGPGSSLSSLPPLPCASYSLGTLSLLT